MLRRYTHKAIRPSDARLNTTLPRAATPALFPCPREFRVRGSRLPTRPPGDRNWGDEQGPRAEVLRLDSIVRNRRAFTFPWTHRQTDGRWLYCCSVLPPWGWTQTQQLHLHWRWVQVTHTTGLFCSLTHTLLWLDHWFSSIFIFIIIYSFNHFFTRLVQHPEQQNLSLDVFLDWANVLYQRETS